MPTDTVVAPRFLFSCSGQEPDTFSVARFSGNDAISTPYSFEITLTSNSTDIDEESIINKSASLLLKRYDEFYPYSGIITSFRYIQTTVDHSTYIAELRPVLWRLSLTVQTRIFQKMSVPSIVEKILKDSGLENYYRMEVGTYPQREYVVQYQESDLNFISRLMEECGIWYLTRTIP